MKTQQSLSASEMQDAYRSFFRSMLEKVGVKSPSQLDKKAKSSFFKSIKATWSKVKDKLQGGEALEVAMASVSSTRVYWDSLSKDDKVITLGSAYTQFFLDRLKTYGEHVNSPALLEPEEKTEFYNSIKRDWPKEKKRVIREAKKIGIILIDPAEKKKIADKKRLVKAKQKEAEAKKAEKLAAKKAKASKKVAKAPRRKAVASSEQTSIIKRQLFITATSLSEAGYDEHADALQEILNSI